MSRRDTIIISVLINAGLLAILFATAWHTEDDGLGDSREIQQAVVEQAVIQQDPVVATFKPAARVVSQQQQEVVIANNTIDSPPETQSTSQIPTNPEYVEVTVKRGDFLGKIATGNGTTVETIMRANNLRSAQLQVGQVLRIPKEETTVATHATTATPNTREIASADNMFYTVQRGDNPWLIARRHNIKLQELLRLNNLDEESARNLRAGQKLRISR